GRALLRLSEQSRSLDPTTGLPGNLAIEREFDRRRNSPARFTLCYLDLDNFKAFNDHFGFARANALIEDLGRILQGSVSGTDHFAGHIGGDDFVLICAPDVARRLVERIQRELREALGARLGAETLAKGTYRGHLRNGEEADIPLTRLAAALLKIDPNKMPPLATLGELAAETKHAAKRSTGDGIVEVEVIG
ncbi:MAG: GGDEF domain-containing protein, partial [Gemmatimonadota bacterium]